jgi:hypothetical protein
MTHQQKNTFIKKKKKKKKKKKNKKNKNPENPRKTLLLSSTLSSKLQNRHPSPPSYGSFYYF